MSELQKTNYHFENEFIKITLEKENTFLRFIYKENVLQENIEDKDYQEAFVAYVQLTNTYTLTHALWDMRFSQLVITPDHEAWIEEQSKDINPTFVKTAVIMSEDIFVKTSAEQFMEEQNQKRITQNAEEDSGKLSYFTSVEEAEAWLNS